MKFISKDSGTQVPDLLAAAVLLFVILNLAVFLLRVVSVWRYGALFTTSGAEPLVIYPVWKALHGLPVYEWPLQYPFSLSIYNYLFYFGYAFFLRLAGTWGAEMMTWGRLMTPGFAILGAIAQWKLVQGVLKLRGKLSALALIFAIGLWLCTSIVRFWAVSIRPDMAAIALVMVALCIVARQPRFGFAYAGVVFYLAWSFKQSVVLALVGVCIYLVLQRRWRDLALLAAVFAALVAATLLIGTPEYRYNILVAPRLVKEFSLRHAFMGGERSLAVNLYWFLAPLALIVASGARRLDQSARLLVTVLVVGLAGGLAGMTKSGGSDNYLLEAFAAGSTLLQMAVFTTPGWLVNLLVLLGCAQPAFQLATLPSGPIYPHTTMTMGVATASEYADAVALRDRLATLPKPLFTTDEVFSLPWFSNDNQTHALMIDSIFHEATRDICQRGCVEGMLRRGEIPTVMLRPEDTEYLESLNPSYEKIGEARHAEETPTQAPWSIYVFHPIKAR
jgi:hypothetical protein